jgi:PAS domain S-box-containing protein
MATPPDYLGLAASSTRALADEALDSLRDAVLVVDARHKHLPIVLANAAARRCLSPVTDTASLIESSLQRWLAGASASTIENMLAVMPQAQSSAECVLEWRCAEGEISVVTDIKSLAVASEQHLVMLTFAPAPQGDVMESTERRLREHLQSSGDLRLLALTEHARDIITVAAPDGTLQYVSGGVRNALGYTSEERQTNNLFDHVHPDDFDALRTKLRQLVDGEIKSYSREFRFRHKDGSYRWLESSYTAALDNPLIGGVVINSRDVTERKMAEGRLAQREEVFRLAADAVDGVIYEWDVSSGFVHRSRGVLEVLGLEPDDVEPTIDAWCERIHPQDFEAANKAISLGLLNGRGWTTTYRIRDARGRYRSILERGLIQRNGSGDPVRAIGCCVDVSEIKRVTDLLAETQRTAEMGGWEYSYATRELSWTDEMYRIYEASPGEFAVSWDSMLGQCTPESLKRFRDACERSEASGEQIDLELEITTLKSRRIWVRIIGHLELLDGRPFRAFGSVQNVQAQKLAQIALESSTGWLKLSMNMANMHAWRWDRARDVFEFAVVDGHEGRLPMFAGMRKFMAEVHPADRCAVKRAVDEAFAHQTEVQKEFRLKANDGRYRWYGAIARPLFDGGNLPRGLVGVIQDITERRDSEARLRRSEELLRATTANTADMLVLVDTGLRVRFLNWSTGGMTIEEIIGREISVLLPESAREGVMDKLRHLLHTGETATYEFQCIEADQVRYFENRAVLVRDDGIGTGISISTRDITERKRLEQEILDVSGRERQSIGRDLHDGLGQELTGIALMLRGLGSRIRERCPEAMDSVNEIVTLVNQSIENARSLARGLLPVRTETGGLAFALRELASRSRDLYGMQVNFRTDLQPDLDLDETDASHLYRIAQEALTNSARHGHATLVDIFLLVTANTFLLYITDNGEGFRPPKAPYSGMGLKIMKYRAGMIGAKFEIGPNEPRGTAVRVRGEQPLTAAVTAAGRH